MATDAKINEKCIIGLPTCGYAFSSSRMAFIAAPGIEILISEEINRDAVRKRIIELTESFHAFPWELLTFQDIQKRVDQEYEGIGEL
jgi:hypothetical protein